MVNSTRDRRKKTAPYSRSLRRHGAKATRAQQARRCSKHCQDIWEQTRNRRLPIHPLSTHKMDKLTLPISSISLSPSLPPPLLPDRHPHPPFSFLFSPCPRSPATSPARQISDTLHWSNSGGDDTSKKPSAPSTSSDSFDPRSIQSSDISHPHVLPNNGNAKYLQMQLR